VRWKHSHEKAIRETRNFQSSHQRAKGNRAMSDIAIRVENLGKQYRIGALRQGAGAYGYQTLRDSISSAFSAPFRKARALVGRREFPESVQDRFWALKDLSFEVRRGDIVGVIGRNGAGKSTLLKILSRITEPTTGHAEIHGRVGSLLEVGTGFHPELTGRDNVFMNGAILGMKRAEIVRQFDAIVEFAGVEKFIDTPVKHYSTGMYLRLAFAVAAHLDTEVLLVDEVLAVGDFQFQEKCLGKIQDVAQTGRTVLLVSHSMSSIQRLCTRAIALANGELIADSRPETVIASYLGAEIGSTYSEAPSDSQPTITRASIRLDGQSLILAVDFQSPFPLVPPVFTFIIYNSLGSPVFGTDNRVDPIVPAPEPALAGRFEVAIPADNFRPDMYLFSIWLSDYYIDHCGREMILKFDLSGSVGGDNPARDYGNIYLRTGWHYQALHAK
jgi:lipopolysaccharide transport system ATP-binding protein